jgi:hypothetical protein
MLDDRDNRVLADTAEQLSREDPRLAALLDGGGDDRWTEVRLPSGRWATLSVVVLAVVVLGLGLAAGSLSLLLLSFGALLVLALIVRRRVDRWLA